MILTNVFSKHYNEGVAIYVSPPSKRTVFFDVAREYDGDYCYCYSCLLDRSLNLNSRTSVYLSFPYVAYKCKYVNFKKSFSFREFKIALSTDAKLKNLYYVPLPNICNTEVCLGTTKFKQRHKSLDDLFKNLIVGFWSSLFNTEITENVENIGFDKILGSPMRWHKKTASNPDWIPDGRLLSSCKMRKYDSHNFKSIGLVDDDDCD